MNRRSLLRSSAALGASLPFWNSLQRRADAAAASGNPKKMIFIFQRGGNDGVNTVIPRGDVDYNTVIRPDIFIPETAAIDSGNGFAQFHPGLAPMMDIYNHSAINGNVGMGNLAAVHRVGYSRQSRSHFDSQDFWERGAPDDPTVKDGMFYRHLEATGAFDTADPGLVAAGLSANAFTSLRGSTPIPNFRRTSDFDFRGNDRKRRAFSDAIRSIYGRDFQNEPPTTATVLSTGSALTNTLDSLVPTRGEYTPANGAVYSNSGLGDTLQEAAILLKRTDISIIGVDLGGHDTHRAQGGVSGDQFDNLNDLALGFEALSKDLLDQWEDLLIVTMTEFGRTSLQNGSGGTDHAEASTMFLAGGCVNGGVYNCDEATWGSDDGALFSTGNERYVAKNTDFRAVFWEIFDKHFGNDLALREQIIPGYALAALNDPTGMAELGILG